MLGKSRRTTRTFSRKFERKVVREDGFSCTVWQTQCGPVLDIWGFHFSVLKLDRNRRADGVYARFKFKFPPVIGFSSLW